jgi:ABC-type lipoprotein export system ATPase subunit
VDPVERPPVIEASGLYHIYREAEVETGALRGARLALGTGSWTSVIGPSGSGKSTLLGLGLAVPTVLREP